MDTLRGMDTTVVTLAAAAALLEGGGIILTIRDIRTARTSLASYLTRRRSVHLSAALSAESAMTLHVAPQNQTLEQRLEAMEAWRRGLADELDQRERKLSERLTRQIHGAVSSAENTVNDRLEGLRNFVVGDGQTSWGKAYRGPIVLGVGLIFGLAGNIVSAL